MRRPVIIYDGQCKFCRKQIERFHRRDKQHLFEYCARLTPGINERFPVLAESNFNTGIRLIHPDGSIAVGADAVYHITRRLRPYKWFAWLYRIPLFHALSQRIYLWIAVNRQHLTKY